MSKQRPPVGIEDFEKLRSGEFYYVNKTGMIKELLENWGEVNLFTRPRRFGKSLNISMLKSFFDIRTDTTLFQGLDITKETSLCQKYMGHYPVISLSLKDVNGSDFAEAKNQMWNLIQVVAEQFDYLQDSEKLNTRDKQNIMQLSEGNGNLESSLHLITRLLNKHYEKKVIILIDEYDVPLQKAELNGYYDQMSDFISRFFSYSMKSNQNMLFAVVTGCLRVVYRETFTGCFSASNGKESIFTGFNNPKVHTIVDDQYDEWFGFTDKEVRDMLDYYDLNKYYELTKQWYDGYRFGTVNVYCPWDVINWCEQLRRSQDHMPKNFWSNSSSNDLIPRFIAMADETTKWELEELSEGKSIDKVIQEELTYAEMNQSIDSLWNVLFTTGYLTQCGRNADGTYRLVIPNQEIYNLFDYQIKQWFYAKIEGSLLPLYQGFDKNSAKDIEATINACLIDSISFLDGGNTHEMKESFYHGLLLRMLRGRRGWRIKSNREAGNGRADIILIDQIKKCGYIIEVKYALKNTELLQDAKKALLQIDDTLYDAYFSDSDIDKIYHYGIAFHKKKCRVMTTK
ncbi:MAG: ATP-binding protein [Clostridiales bacterium]|nr:ATP-binding protein [Clostridiales bacterium]